MMRTGGAKVLVVCAAAVSGCTCSNPTPSPVSPPPPPVASAVSVQPSAAPSLQPVASVAVAAGAWAPTPGSDVFSGPIAAVKVAGDHILAAGLVLSAESIRLVSLSLSGTIEWSSNVLSAIRWKSGVRLRVFPAGDGAAVVWTGERANKTGTFVALVGPRGEAKGEVFEIGSEPCSTQDALVWTESAKGGPVKVRMRRYGETSTADVTTLRVQAAPRLSCGDHTVYGFADDEDDNKMLHVLVAADGKPQKPLVVVSSKEFQEEDEERSFDAYLDGDDLGMVRGLPNGDILVRELTGGALTPWRKLAHSLESDESVEDVDADHSKLVVIYSKESVDDCPQGARKIHALGVDRKTKKETDRVISPAVCGKEVSGIWLAELPARSFVAAWEEPGTRSENDGAPIGGFAFAPLAEGTPAVHLKVAADFIVDARCDQTACYAVALARTPGTDGMAPEAFRVLKYP